MEFNRENMKKIREIILFIAALLILIWKYELVFAVVGFLFQLVFPFILGGAIAFILNVPLSFLEKHIFPRKRLEKHKRLQKMARPLSIVLVFILALAVLGLVTFVVIPELGSSLAHLATNIKDSIPKIQDWVEELFRNNKDALQMLNKLELNWSSIADGAVKVLNQGVNTVLNSTFTFARSIVSGLATFFIALVFSVYILLQKRRLSLQAKKVLFAFVKKDKADKVVEIFALTHRTFSNFLTGQCVEAVILGTMFFITMTVLRFPYALLVALLIMVTALIPIFGAFIGCFVGAFLIVMVNPMQALGFIVMFLVLQQIEGNLIYPHVVGSSVGLPSIWVLAAVTIGGSLLGVVGMLIFIPIISVLYTILRAAVNERLKKKQIRPADMEKKAE